ncbi:hypothetical protein [Rossellomorea vietnamensis]|uniref:hypothetical protein n=1 Tax=Rossellomorea vietnamensis TaxID=218284 RepID=UPI000550DD41|nr:hypothetical protein [Rossellomorea vietnamensis]
MRNTLGDLNNHLFAQLERLSDEEITGKKLQEEIDRARSISGVASRIIDTGNLVLSAKRLQNDQLNPDVKIPKMLEG